MSDQDDPKSVDKRTFAEDDIPGVVLVTIRHTPPKVQERLDVPKE
jgi:hypothetical protein